MYLDALIFLCETVSSAALAVPSLTVLAVSGNTHFPLLAVCERFGHVHGRTN